MSGNYFEDIKRSYKDVSTTPGVDTVQFLEATEGVVGLFDLLGSKAFAAVTADMNGNIAKIKARYEAHTAESATLESLVENEKGEKKRVATEGLLWLLRGLRFTYEAMVRSSANKEEELSVSFTKGYEGTLKQYHNFMVKGVFTLAMKACPYRKDFYAKLGSPLEKVESELKLWLDALGSILTHLEKFYQDGGYNKGF